MHQKLSLHSSRWKNFLADLPLPWKVGKHPSRTYPLHRLTFTSGYSTEVQSLTGSEKTFFWRFSYEILIIPRHSCQGSMNTRSVIFASWGPGGRRAPGGSREKPWPGIQRTRGPREILQFSAFLNTFESISWQHFCIYVGVVVRSFF